MKARYGILAALAMLCAFVCLQGCGHRKLSSRAHVSVTQATQGAAVAAEGSSFASASLYDKLAAEDAGVKPIVPDYTVESGLANVANAADFKPVMTKQLAALIARNGFGVTPTDYIQMFHVYENNEYQRPRKYPSFITTDSMLHTYHVFYDYTLRQVESTKLFDAAVDLTNRMLRASQRDVTSITRTDALLKVAARRNVAYFAVARALLTGKEPPSDVASIVNTDLQQISDHQDWSLSEVLGYKINFSQFVPRGHYTRSEKLKRYFKAMMWYGLAPFPIPNEAIGKQPTLQALMIVRNLRDKTTLKLWDTVYEPTAFYVGTADDYTFYQYADLMDKVYGSSPALDDFADRSKLDDFIGDVKKLAGPGIEQYSIDPTIPVGRQFRFMGQRFIPDSRVLQELTHNKVQDRRLPMGLDVLAAMGSDRALDILGGTYKAVEFPQYAGQMTKVRKELRETPRPKWQSNLYYGWLWSLQSLPKPAPSGYPAFMHGDAWLDKSLLTALGSWTELRHDTILYAKQSAVAECGGDGEGEEPPPTPKGYVEPNLEFWTKLKWLNDYTLAGLGSRRLLDEELKDKFAKLGDWIDFCRKITVKELTGKKVTEEEYQQICLYGAELEQLTLSFAGGELVTDTDKDMAIVADVHTANASCLEEGTGRAAAIYVVVPIEGKLYLTRGAVYTQYEFTHPASDRLTDEKWQKMLDSKQAPALADWTKSFYTDTDKKPDWGFENGSGGC